MPTPKKPAKKKASVGGGSLRAASKFNLKRALPLIVILALTGSFLVFQSFASAGSEAEVTAWYRTCSNREPDSGGLSYWANRLDNARKKGGEGEWATSAAFMASASVSTCSYANTSKTPESPKPPATPAIIAPVTPTASTGSAKAAQDPRVVAYYTACQYGSIPKADSESHKYWVGVLNSVAEAEAWKKFAGQSKANGIKTCPDKSPYATSDVGPKINQNVPLGATNYQAQAEAWVALGAGHIVNADKENKDTYKRSIKSVVSRNDLSAIANKEGYVRSAITEMQKGKTEAQGLYNRANSNTKTKSQGPAITNAINTIQAQINTLSGYAGNIAADYKRAESKYEGNINFFQQVGDKQRQERDCIARGGKPTWTGDCNFPKQTGAIPVTIRGSGLSGTDYTHKLAQQVSDCNKKAGYKYTKLAGCKQLYSNPMNPLCKSGFPGLVYQSYAGADYSYKTYFCPTGFKSMDCYPDYKEASWDVNKQRLHGCVLALQ